jgi:ribonuclease P protein component|tara:strand:+ start:272 stop:619 length:348 start_codon:yes stop_codon:yes gene_type:complete
LVDNRFQRFNRIFSAHGYRKVFSGGLRSRGKFFLVIFKPNINQQTKLGLAVSKKYCRLAIQRNTIKRIIRESFRKNKDKLQGFDIVVLNNKLTHTVNQQSLRTDLLRQWDEIERN